MSLLRVRGQVESRAKFRAVWPEDSDSELSHRNRKYILTMKEH